MTITQEYDQQGYYIAKRLLVKTEVSLALDNLKKTFDDQLHFLGLGSQQTIHKSMQLLHHHDIERYKKTVGSLWRKLSIYNLLHSPKIQDFVHIHFHWQDIIIPGGQVVLIMSESLKIPNGYFGFPVHQDYPSIQGSLDGMVVWVPLMNIDKNRYPMEVIPGSHKKRILPSFESDTSGWVVKPEAYQESDLIPVECEVGDVVFMSNFLAHRSSIKGDGRLRLACSTRYDNANEKTFVERCYPTAYLRSVHRGLFDSTRALMERK